MMLKNNIPCKCEYIMIFNISKIWFMSKNYGVKLQLLKIQVKMNEPTVNDNNFEFIDSEIEGDHK